MFKKLYISFWCLFWVDILTIIDLIDCFLCATNVMLNKQIPTNDLLQHHDIKILCDAKGISRQITLGIRHSSSVTALLNHAKGNVTYEILTDVMSSHRSACFVNMAPSCLFLPLVNGRSEFDSYFQHWCCFFVVLLLSSIASPSLDLSPSPILSQVSPRSLRSFSVSRFRLWIARSQTAIL